MKVILNDGTVLNSVGVHGNKINFQGFQRDSLIFIFDPAEYSLEQIDGLFTPANCSAIGLQDDNSEHTDYHDDYSIRVSLSIGHPEFGMGDISGNPVYITVKMAQVTFLEKNLLATQEELELTQMAMSEMDAKIEALGG